MPTVRVQALAKVNLGLRILYRRPDHFHELRTVFQTISLADRIELDYRRQAGGPGGRSVELSCNRPDLAGPDNLAARAALRLLEATGSKGRVRIQLDKIIPAGAGLGGGSSDAGAVLLALASRLRPAPPFDLLLRLAAELGSDVPFFLLGGRALGVGRGTEIYPLPDTPARWLLVAAPPIHVSTAEAYRQLSPTVPVLPEPPPSGSTGVPRRGRHAGLAAPSPVSSPVSNLTTTSWEDKIDRFCSSVCVPEWGPGLENDFEPVVFRMHPELEKLKALLKRGGAFPALLCGSGSAVFGLFADRRQALRARDSLDLEDGRCFVIQTVSRTGYRARWRKWLSEV